MKFAGELAALGTAVCWAIGSNLFAAAGRRMGAMTLNRLRVSCAALILAAALAVVRGSPWPTWASSTQIGLLAASGVIGYVFGDYWYFRSLVILGAGRAALIASLAPLFTAALGRIVLDERLGPMTWLGMILTVGGVASVMLERRTRDHASLHGRVSVGIVAGMLGAIGQAGGFVFSKLALRTGIDPLSATVIRITVAAVAIGILTVLQRQVRPTLGALRDPTAAGFMLSGTVFGPVLGVVLSLAALQLIQAGVAASIIAVFPIPALVISARFHGEPLTLRTLLGAMLAVIGVVVLFLR